MLLELSDVRKRYGSIQALRGLTASLDGKLIGLLGPNGAGKSTLLKVLLGLTPFEGSASILGLDPKKHTFQIRDRVGYMPEMDSALPQMNAVELCAYAARLSGLPAAAAMQRAHAALYYAGLEDKRYQPVDGYSTGMKQRVKLAQALVHDPELLFLDEPTNGLDPAAREDMLALIEDLPKRRSLTVILSTHLLPDVERICDRVMVLKDGQLQFAGTVDELRGDTGGHSYEVRVKRDVEKLADALRAKGCAVDSHPDGLTLTMPGDNRDTDLIFAAASQCGVQIRHLAPRRATLEEGFLRKLSA